MAHGLLRGLGVGRAAWGVGDKIGNQDSRDGRTMAKTQRSGQAMKRMARQVKGTAGRVAAKAARPVAKVQVTLGDLIAAAMDVAGETKAAAQLVSSRAMEQVTGRHIVFVG